MRALMLCVAVTALFFSTGARSSGNPVPSQANASGPAPHFSGNGAVGWNRPGIGSWSGHMDPQTPWRETFHRFARTRYVYVLPAYAGQTYQEPDDADAGYDPSDVRTEYVTMPVEQVAAPAPRPAPPKPAQVVQYTTSADPPVKIAAGARVTKGTVYKYTKDGVDTYTNVPPPDAAHAKLLFAYTEAVSTAAARTLYRCTGGKPGNVGYSEIPVPNQDCKPLSYADSSVN